MEDITKELQALKDLGHVELKYEEAEDGFALFVTSEELEYTITVQN